LRTILSAGVLVLLLAGTAAGVVTWVVDDDACAGVDFCDDTDSGECSERWG